MKLKNKLYVFFNSQLIIIYKYEFKNLEILIKLTKKQSL